METLIAFLLTATAIVPAPPPAAAAVVPNDNLKPAGRIEAGRLSVDLYAATGLWRPKGPSGPALDVAAFGEPGTGLSVPGPLIRAKVGTTVALTLRNDLDGALTVFGLCSKPGACDPFGVPPGETRTIALSLSAPGTYHYWASRTARTLTSRPAVDSQLGGAIVVDPPGAAIPDRVIVISIHGDGSPFGLCVGRRNDIFTLNGQSWPYTPRLHYTVGDAVRFRVVNLSCDQHAMHLHGFHFVVNATGDGYTNQPLEGDGQRMEVTELVPPGRTFSLAWRPTRAGNWLFHCHMVGHMTPSPTDPASHHTSMEDGGMEGLVMGIEVTGPPSTPIAAPSRQLSMILTEDRSRYGDGQTGFRVELEGTEAPRLNDGPVPGPVLLLTRDEPAEITVVNRTSHPTAIHWHGLEIESYFDGVPGFGGLTGQLAPPIEPGKSFAARMAPPRAGTFIYHTHWHDEAQLAGGIYGPLIVLEPGAHFDPSIDHIVVIGLNGVDIPNQREPFAMNGRAQPAPVPMKAGVRNRLRLINITANNVALVVSLVAASDPVQWTPLAKDGATVPASRSTPRAARQMIGVGETYDFEVTPSAGQLLWLEVRRGNGEWVMQAPVQVR